MGFGDLTELSFRVTETPHFIFASTGRFRVAALAETAEALWHGMAFQHMNFRRDWGDKKKVIIITTDDEIYKKLGEWYTQWIQQNALEPQEGADIARRISATWMESSGNSLNLPETQQKKYKAFSSADILRVREGHLKSFTKPFSPFPTHMMSDMLIRHQMGGVSDISPNGYFALTTGHGYFKEIKIAGKSETTLIAAGDYADNEISSAKGFDTGKSWARSLRKLVRRKKVKPNLEELINIKTGRGLTPEQLVLIYSLSHYMQSTPERVASYAKMIKRIESNNQVPALIEIAKIFNFKSVEELEKDWTEYITSNDFK